MDSFQHEEKYTEASQNEASNNTIDSWQIGAPVTIIHADGRPVGFGFISGPGIVTETL